MVFAGKGSNRRPVKTGISDNMDFQIISGVDEGEEIVIGSYRILPVIFLTGIIILEQNK